MKKFTNPLDNIRIASPCPADWNKMYGDERKRFCSECKLNVYNLSDMTQTEAENFLIDSEGRVCVKFYRRKDGTILTKDCPVGWQKLKRRVSRFGTAVFASLIGLFSGIFAFNQMQLEPLNLEDEVTVEFEEESFRQDKSVRGKVENLENIQDQIMGKPIITKEGVVGHLALPNPPENNRVIAWIE